jgi:GGDEF domain-containing protein
MKTFDRTDLDNLERRELQLSILAAVIVLVMAGGVAVLMYPIVFQHPDEANKWTMRVAFVGFCVLSLLFVGYLLDRQRTVRHLKQQLLEELDRNLALRHQASVDLLRTMPDLNRFWDCLAMEHRRALTMQKSLSLLIVTIKTLPSVSTEEDADQVWGEAAKAMARKLRPGDSNYHLDPGVFGIVLPETETAEAKAVARQLEEVLHAVGEGRFSAVISTYNFPEHVGSEHELEEIVRAVLATRQNSQSSAAQRGAAGKPGTAGKPAPAGEPAPAGKPETVVR